MNNNIVNVNMVPNSFDIGVLECSQGDTEARKFKLRLMHGKDPIDISGVQEPLLPQFPVYKGGTEEILPTNGSAPSTAPIIADIQYPQGLLADQEFFYRDSPSEEDGFAKPKSIKGNTLGWNQLIRNGNFADTSNWSAESGATLSISNNIATISSTTASNGIRQYLSNSLTVNHKYLVKAEFNVPSEYRCVIGTGASQGIQIEKLISTANTWTEVSGIGTCTASTTAFYCFVRGTTYENVKIRNVMCFDLTQMGLDISNPRDFTSLFPLSYYSYNQGSLLSFNGNGIKTVGFNQWDEEWEVGAITTQGTPSITADRIRSKNFIPVMPNTTYYRKSPNNIQPFFYDENQQFIEYGYWNRGNFPTPSNCAYMKFQVDPVYGLTYNNDICINISDASKNGTYEPYTSSTLSLPVSTYFPTGMKSAGSVYDELTESKAITRVGSVDLGSLTWTYANDAGHLRFVSSTISPNAKLPANNTIANAVCTKYGIVTEGNVYNNQKVGLCIISNSRAMVYDPNYTDATAFKQAMTDQNVKLYYELATETETDITIASLLAENGEIPLTVEDDYLVGVCNQDISKKAGTYDGKVKLVNGGTVYSNKVQIHVERRPE